MEFLVEARTQASGVCAFDAAALPPEVDRPGPQGGRAAVTEAGKAWFADTPGQGSWPVLVRVDAHDATADDGPPVHRGTLHVPSGRLWVCGAEFLALDPAAGSARTPEGGLARHAMGDCVDVPPGTYYLSVFEHDTTAAAAREVAAPGARRRLLSRILEFGGYLVGGIGVAGSAWTLYALWFADTDETWQEVLRQNVPALLAFLVAAWAMLFASRVIDGFEAAREANEAARAEDADGAVAIGAGSAVRASTAHLPSTATATATSIARAAAAVRAPQVEPLPQAPAYTLVLSRIADTGTA